MHRSAPMDARLASIGLWNGAADSSFGRLLYRALLQDAMASGLLGGTAIPCMEGSRGKVWARSFDNEVSSNRLPIWLEFVDSPMVIENWLPRAMKVLGGSGIVTVQSCLAWRSGVNLDGGGDDMKFVWSASRGRLVDDRTTMPSGLQVRLYTVEGRQLQGRPVYQAVGEFLRRHGILWVSTTRGLYGFGQHRREHRASWWRGSADTPIVMTAVDKYTRLAPLVPELVELVGDEAFVTSSVVEQMDAPQDRVQPEKNR